MSTQEKITVKYSYSYVDSEHDEKLTFFTNSIGKLPKIKMILPKISIDVSEEYSYSFC